MNKKYKGRVMLYTTVLDTGGVARYFKRINDAFNGYDIASKLIFLREDTKKKTYDKEKSYFENIKFLKDSINKENPNSIITNHGIETLMTKIAILISRKKIKLISIIHIRSVMWIPNYKNKIKKLMFKSLIKASFKVCDKCIAVSEGLKNEVIAEGWIKEEKIKTIYNPVIEDDFYGQVKELRENRKVHLAIIGWVYDIKNQIEAIRAIKELNDEKYILHIIGGIKDEEYYKELKRQIRKDKLEKQIIFEGTKKDIFKELKKIDLLLVTSKTEALPTVIIEAISSGTPVIASNCKFGAEEILLNKNENIYELGKIEELVKKIKGMLENKELYNKVSKKGLERAKDFKYKNIIEKYSSFLRES